MIDEIDARILEIVQEYGQLTIMDVASSLGVTRSWAWKKVKRLERAGLLRLEKRGRSIVVRPAEHVYKGLLRIGILRASEYPYILHLRHLLLGRYSMVKIIVYDEAYKLALDLAAGKVQLAMAPVVTLMALHRLSAGRIHIIGGGSHGGSGIIYSRSQGVGHATTMASTMELCAEAKKLPGPRIYMRSGSEILEAVLDGRVGMGIVWEPYLYHAKEMGLDVEECGLPFCCVLGANKSLEPEYSRLSRYMEEAISRAIAGTVDLEAYSKLVGFPTELVKKTVKSYGFITEPPINSVRVLLDAIRNTIIPDKIVGDAFRVGP
ncbi:MAG: AsnC family transcriptional regulator [Desulfurococcales archaeon]|nr:AsnC family transcriptional regulator [Desulfurococcales archaeon]